jgi:hypothetical protein
VCSLVTPGAIHSEAVSRLRDGRPRLTKIAATDKELIDERALIAEMIGAWA